MKKSKKNSNLEILDCTIRDGGYLNNWNFDKRIVKDLYRNLSRAGVDYVEIGFRNIQKKDVGIWYSTPEELINELFEDSSGAKIALMIDDGRVDQTRIPDARKSLVKMYRIACHKNRVAEAIEVCEEIKDKGYKTSLQLMGIVGYKKSDITPLIRSLSKSSFDYIYFADSYGSLFPQDIKRYVDWLAPTEKKVGFHPHNNLQLAFANTLEAIKQGVTIVDGTVHGMGRGAGNLPLEVLIAYLEKTVNPKKYNSIPVLDLIDRYFKNLKDELGWGYNLPYMLSGTAEVHPDYVKTLMDEYQYSMEEMSKILDVIKSLDLIGFKRDVLDRLIQTGFSQPEGQEEIPCSSSEIKKIGQKHSLTFKNRHAGRDFLILANGPTLKEHKKEIDEFIERYNPIVIGANFLGGLFVPHYHGFSNKKRFMSYADFVHKDSQLLLSSAFEEQFIREHTNRAYETIPHLNRLSGSFEIKNDVITSNCRTVSILLIGAAILMGAKRIFIAGMDGYKNKENFLKHKTHFYQESAESQDFKALLELHHWNEKLLHSINAFLTTQNKEGLHIITPTSHKYFYTGIYHLSI